MLPVNTPIKLFQIQFGKKKLCIILSLIIFVLYFPSCNKKSKVKEYIKYIDNKENGLIKSSTIGADKITCEYKTSEYLIIKEKAKETVNLDSILILADELENMSKGIFFKLVFESTNNKDFLKAGIKEEKEYFSRLQYIQSGVKDDLYLILNQDTLTCMFSEFERDFGLSGKVTLNLGFLNEKKIQLNQDLVLIFNDQSFGFGKQDFKFSKINLLAIPKF